MRGKRRSLWRAAFSVLFVFHFVPDTVFSQTPFYQGKTITLVRGSTPGGVGERRVRAVIPYLSKHIPGNPTVLIEFMPGAGGRKAANFLFNTARPTVLPSDTSAAVFSPAPSWGRPG